MTALPHDPVISSIVAAPADATASGAAADLLAGYRWNHRILLLFFDGPDDPGLRAQQVELTPHAPGLAERDIVVIVSADPALRRRLSVPASGFMVLLLGKDGGVKLRSASPITFVELAAVVDAMPMRQDEMNRGNGKRR